MQIVPIVCTQPFAVVVSNVHRDNGIRAIVYAACSVPYNRLGASSFKRGVRPNHLATFEYTILADVSGEK